MDTPRHEAALRDLARLAYRTLEPYHLVGYFGPHVDTVREELGIGWLGAYTGMRAAPLGAVPPEVVAATFFGFAPAAITKAWGLALAHHTPSELNTVRTRCVDAGLRLALGHLVDSRDLAALAQRLRGLSERMDHGGRALSAAYAAQPWPQEPHLALWHASTLWREWRGDGHIAALTTAGLRPVEALVLYDAWLRVTSPERAAASGRGFLEPTRKWTPQEWAGAIESLTASGLLAVGEDAVITPEGQRLRDDVERATDDAAASVWAGVEDAADVLASFRPFSKAVIATGWLPGTRPPR